MSDTIPQDVLQKQCSDCKQFFPPTVEFFPADTRLKCGLRSQCKVCRSNQRTQHRNNHIDEYRVYETSRIDKHRIDNVKYKNANRDKIRRDGREYSKAHPEQYRANTRNRRARIRKATGKHTVQDVRNQYANQKGKCYYCSKKVDKTYHVDHVIPIAKGGSNGPENLVISCPTCNMSKRDKIIRLL